MILAEKIGSSQAAVAKWESGTTPTAENKKKLEKVLGPLSKKGRIKEGAAGASDVSSFGLWVRE